MELDNKTALLILDVQKALNEPEFDDKNHPEFDQAILDLLTFWRARHWPVFHVKHVSHDPLSPYFSLTPSAEFKEKTQALGGESVIAKEHPCAFTKTALGSMLRMDGCERVLICGALTHQSVDATARQAVALGFETAVVHEATCAVGVEDFTGVHRSAHEVHDLTLGVLKTQNIHVVTLSEVMSLLG